MTTSHYNRSEIYNFWDLTAEQQAEAIGSAYSEQQAEQTLYVIFTGNHPNRPQILSLDMFVRTNSKFWNGVYGTSYFSAYYIKLSKCRTQAVIAEKFN